jgi:hypothetical protein
MLLQNFCQETPPAELNEWIVALQTADPVVDRRRLSAKISDIVSAIYVATEGKRWKPGEIEKKLRQSELPEEAATLIRKNLANSVLINPYFKVFLRDGGEKVIVPDLNSPTTVRVYGQKNSHGAFSWGTHNFSPPAQNGSR